MENSEHYDHPHRLHLETTKRCNLLCEHCYISAADNFTDHDSELLKKVMLDTKNKGATRITLTGGEFLIRKDHKELIEYSIKIGYRNIYFISNGIYLNKGTLEWLSKLKVNETLRSLVPTITGKTLPLTIGIGISLDGLRGNGLIRKFKNSTPVPYKKILDKIKLATNYGFFVTVNTTVCNATTASELFPMYKELLSINIDRWQIDQVFMSGRSTCSPEIQNK